LTAIYLSVKPESYLIKQFFGTVLVSQLFNFDLLSMSLCGTLGTLSSILVNMIPLAFIPKVIQTRDVSGINFPLAAMGTINLFIWASYAIIKQDPFMTVSQVLGFIFNVIILMFYFWAKNQINSIDTPLTWIFMRPLIKFFKQFEVQKNLKEMQSFFWHDEETETAKAWIATYKDDIM
jgi:uncharacterized protein with PQ loop repeat